MSYTEPDDAPGMDDGDDVQPEYMERKLYGSDLPPGTVDLLPSVGDPAVGVDSQNNDEHYVYDTDAAIEARDVLG